MTQRGVLAIPPNTNFGVSVFVNADFVQTVSVKVDGQEVASFTGDGLQNRHLGTRVLNSGTGAVTIGISANGKTSDLVSARVTLGGKLNIVMLGSEDWTDADYNDSVVILNWPLG